LITSCRRCPVRNYLPADLSQPAPIIIAGHVLIQNIRRGYYELGVDEPVALRVADFDELALAI
jgi:hypothetical protein